MVVFVLGACASIERLAIPDKVLIEKTLSQSGHNDDLNHKPWDQFLENYTKKDKQGVVRVDYARVSDEDHAQLKTYIETLSSVNVENLSKNAQLAYWANLYNATTVNVILENYPVSSIRDIKDGFFDLGPWDEKRLTINGRATSLHDIEHGIVRPLWSDTPEIHYILNCAAAGCPNLAQQAYTAANVQSRMRQAASDYVNDPLRGVIIQDNGRVVVSKIYSWYQDDFGGSQSSILNHIKHYANQDLGRHLGNKSTIDSFIYDWSLNDAKNFNTLKKPIFTEHNYN